jgi:aldehyde dehydrogenase (NAD+)
MTQSNYLSFVNGKWVSTEKVFPNINPSDLDNNAGYYETADAELTHAAVLAAKTAFTDWSQSNIQQRSNILDFIGNEILSRKSELGEILATEEGKTLKEAQGEVGRAAQIFKFYAGEALRLKGEIIPSIRPHIDVEVTREPVGVVGLITPWNFPIAIPAWKIAPALAYGNTVVFKPAELTPGSAWALAEIISRSGLPKGVFNMVLGSGPHVGQAILDNPDVAAVSFTGSQATGQKVAKTCVARGAKFQLEMGGKNPLVVLADANMETAINCAVNGAFFSTGQKCTASSRLIVQDSVYDEFTDKLINQMKSLTVGNALSDTTQIGPVVSEAQLKQNLKYVQIGLDEGAHLAAGGQRLELETKGFYMSPALFVDTQNNMRINQEEIFGPIATIIKTSDFDEAVKLANDTKFGLSAGICTNSLSSARQFKRLSQAGMVMVNLPTAGVDYHVPFGGTKSSSYGPREQGSNAAEFYTTVKTTYIG